MKHITALFFCSIFMLTACDDSAQSSAWFLKNRADLATTITQCVGSAPTLPSDSKACLNASAAMQELGQAIVPGYAILGAGKLVVEEQAVAGIGTLNKGEDFINQVPDKFPSMYINAENGEITVKLIDIAKGIELYAVPTVEGKPLEQGKAITEKIMWTCYTNLPAAEHIILPKNCRNTRAVKTP